MYKTIISALKKAKKIGIFTHVCPDGDAMGSSYSLKLVLHSMGKLAEVYLLPNADTKAYSLINGLEPTALKKEDCDLLIALDCADSKRLGEYEDFFLAFSNTAAVDHHVTHKPYSKIYAVPEVSSTCEAMYGLYKQLGVTVTGDIAQNLYVGLATDTGSFKYSCVTPDTMRTAADLIECGANHVCISRKMFGIKSKEYYCLMRTALDNLKYFDDGKICVLVLTQDNFDAVGLTEAMASEIVTLPLSVEGVAVGVYIRKRSDSEHKISLRSDGSINVADIAAGFGGGGHVCAAGYSVFDSDSEEIISILVSKIRESFK